MKRLPLLIGVSVFLLGVTLELSLISILPGGFSTWFALPDRPAEFAARLGMQLINALVAGYLAHSAERIAKLFKAREERQIEQERFLNHHVRNALSSLQYAAHLTSDEKVVETCDSAIKRIVWALSSVRQENQSGRPRSSKRLRRHAH